jgi:DNA-3-methyladenine glycosylase I
MKKQTCTWVKHELDHLYHDNEWGIPKHDDQKIFETLILETFQAGLSWITILKKRENFRAAFDNFDMDKIALYQEDKIEELLQNKGIVRNKLKVRATVTNAIRFKEVQKEFGTFDKYIWQFVGNKPIMNQWKTSAEVPANTSISDAMSKDLKKRGFKFVGTTICYAFMQALGMVNDHLTTCFRYDYVNQQ